MQHRFRIAIMFGALTVGAGCATTQPPESVVVDPSSDPSWMPPGQGDLAVADAPVEEKPKAKPRARRLQEPNHREIDRRPLLANSGGPRP